MARSWSEMMTLEQHTALALLLGLRDGVGFGVAPAHDWILSDYGTSWCRRCRHYADERFLGACDIAPPSYTTDRNLAAHLEEEAIRRGLEVPFTEALARLIGLDEGYWFDLTTDDFIKIARASATHRCQAAYEAMMRRVCFHGTSRSLMGELVPHGLAVGSFVSTRFDLAASDALHHPDPLVVVVSGITAHPDDPTSGGELVAREVLPIRQCLVPRFDSWPEDFYELGSDLSGRKYPELFDWWKWKNV